MSAIQEEQVYPVQSRTVFVAGRVFIYSALLLWAFVCLFPIYWTVTTSFKTAPNVMQGHIVPWLQFSPDWRGWRSLGLSPDTIFETSTVREEFLKRFLNSVISSVSASALAIVIGSLAAYGLTRYRYQFAWFKNEDISFFFLSQLILPPVVLALPFLVLYKEVDLLDTRIGLILLYTLMVLPIALPGMVAAFILALVLCWNEYFFAALLTSTNAKTLPVMVASQTGSQGINWWSMAALSAAAIAPLIVIGVFLERYIVKGLTAGSVK